MTSTRATAEFHYDPFSQAAMNDPLSLYHELRDSHPVYYMPQYDTFAISRFEDVYQVLGDTSDTFQTTEGSTPSPDRLRVHFDAGMPLPPTDRTHRNSRRERRDPASILSQAQEAPC